MKTDAARVLVFVMRRVRWIGEERGRRGVGEIRAEPLIPPYTAEGGQDGGFGGHPMEGGGK